MLYLQDYTCFTTHTKMPILYMQCSIRLYSSILNTLYILYLHSSLQIICCAYYTANYDPNQSTVLQIMQYTIVKALHCTYLSQHLLDILRTVHMKVYICYELCTLHHMYYTVQNILYILYFTYCTMCKLLLLANTCILHYVKCASETHCAYSTLYTKL